ASRLVTLMGGQISLNSKKGIGSVFTFSIKVMRPQVVSVVDRSSESHSENVSATAMRVLLVEDNVVNQRLSVKILEQAGHDVVLATNGMEAVDAALEGSFDIILMDIQMPIMGGEEATRAIRSMKGGTNQSIPIIALTAHAMAGDREKYLAAGMNGYITKPINRPHLLQTLKEHAQGKKDASSE
ncbi:MAG: response regulator, partial [Bdellovibrionales bacterium]|nr:response regulator [Bdellovibrionales bacterium]